MNSTAPRAPLLSGRTVRGPVSARINLDGRQYINFFGSGYLALSGIPEIREAVQRALQEGVAFAQHVPRALGTIEPAFDAAERGCASVFGTQASVYFPSGYLIGAVVLASFEAPFGCVVIDEGAHFSLRDAALISDLPTYTYGHCDADSLSDTLRQESHGKRPLLMTDGIFATTGRMPPLDEYAVVLQQYDGRMLVDESHSFGVVGPNRRGAAEYCRVEHLSAVGATLSKAFCAQGATVPCSAQSALRLRTIPPLRGACAGSPLSAIAAAASIEYTVAHPEIHQHMSAMKDYLRTRLRGLGTEVFDSPAPIVSFKMGSREDMLNVQQRAWDRGVYIYHSTYLGAGDDGLIRCAVFRDHTSADIDALIDALATA